MIGNKSFFIISAYYPSGNNDSLFKVEIHNLFESLNLENMNNFYILAGDLNCKYLDWKNPIDNQKGVKLKEWIFDNEINFRCKLYASNFPSFPRTGSYLDVCIADCRIYIHILNESINSLETVEFDSDHDALQINASMNKELEEFTFIIEPPININLKKQIGKNFNQN